MRCCARTRGAPSGGGANKRRLPATRCTCRRRSGRRCWWPMPARPALPSRSPGKAPTCCTRPGSRCSCCRWPTCAPRSCATRSGRCSSSAPMAKAMRPTTAPLRRRLHGAGAAAAGAAARRVGARRPQLRQLLRLRPPARRLVAHARVDAAVRAHRRRQRRHAGAARLAAPHRPPGRHQRPAGVAGAGVRRLAPRRPPRAQSGQLRRAGVPCSTCSHGPVCRCRTGKPATWCRCSRRASATSRANTRSHRCRPMAACSCIVRQERRDDGTRGWRRAG